MAAATIAAASVGNARAADAPPVDSKALLEELKGLKTKRLDVQRQRFDGIAAKLLAASRSDDTATRVYSEAIRDMDFSGGTKDASRFKDWRDRNKDLLSKDKAFGAAARLHLQYLAISLMRAARPEGDPPFRELWEYVKGLALALNEYGGALTANDASSRLLTDPITKSPVARANFLTGDLENLTDWELSAGSLDGILEKNLRTPLRAIKDMRLMETWKMQIEYEQQRMANAKGELAKATFYQVGLPKLYWGQARDLIVIGQKNQGIAEMAKIVRAYPAHPDLAGWVDEITAVLEPPSVDPNPAPR